MPLLLSLILGLFVSCSCGSPPHPPPRGPLGRLFPLAGIVLGEPSSASLALEEDALVCASALALAAASLPPRAWLASPLELDLRVALVEAAERTRPLGEEGPPSSAVRAARYLRGEAEGVAVAVGGEQPELADAHFCVDRRAALALAVGVRVVAVMGLCIGHWARGEPPALLVPTIAAFGATLVSPLIINYGMQHLPEGFLSSVSSVTRAPLFVTLLALRLLIVPPALLLLVLSRVAPHMLDAVKYDQVGLAVGLGVVCEMIATHLYAYSWVEPAVLVAGGLVVVALHRAGRAWSREEEARALLWCGSSLLAFVSGHLALFSLHVLLLSALLCVGLVLHSIWEKRSAEAAVVGSAEGNGSNDEGTDVSSSSTPKTFMELKRVFQQLPIVGERQAIINNLVGRCLRVGSPFELIVLRGKRGVGKSRLIREVSVPFAFSFIPPFNFFV